VAIQRERANPVPVEFGEPQIVVRTDGEDVGIAFGVWELEFGQCTVRKVQAPDAVAAASILRSELGEPKVPVRAHNNISGPAVWVGQLELRDVSPSVWTHQS